jgi:hypothetical protein
VTFFADGACSGSYFMPKEAITSEQSPKRVCTPSKVSPPKRTNYPGDNEHRRLLEVKHVTFPVEGGSAAGGVTASRGTTNLLPPQTRKHGIVKRPTKTAAERKNDLHRWLHGVKR